ncbi:MAG: hypothetical protein H7Z74_06730 [Anaerolineae bacterium]|nr:hypothetical protein [Gemmatimonadaceae bacterium]
MTPNKVYLLSPARCDGKRAELLLNPHADFALARQLREPEGASLGEVFSFLSGLYFRGKLTYARNFAIQAGEAMPIMIITTSRGLRTPDERVVRADLVEFAGVDIAAGDARYLEPLRRDIASLDKAIGPDVLMILLGSIATGKYVDALMEVFGERLVFPIAFVGRGDMSRGGLLLRQVTEGRELEYAPVVGAVRHGPRPPKLVRLR